MYVHTRERDIRPGFDGVKIKFYYYIIIIKDEYSLSEYLLQIDALTFQFKSSFLKRNTTKTKELMLGGGRTTQPPKPIFIDNQEVEIVKSFKYLGTLRDETLSFCDQESATTTVPTEKAEKFRC